MDRIILHCDCNSFFASCEELLDPELKKVPMAVTGDPENRHGIILAKNQLAKKYNINTAETIWSAKQKCPSLVCVLAHRGLYHEISEKINKIYLEYTDLVEPASIDESYLDVTNSIHLFNISPVQLADLLRERVRSEIGVTISVGVSFCKTIAKFGSDYKKPDATTVISKENMSEIYWKAPVSDMLFVGKKTVEKLKLYNISTIGQLANCNIDFLQKNFGKNGYALYDMANGMEEEPVRSFYEEREVKSIGNSMTFRRDIIGEKEIKAGLSFLADSVARRLRADNKKCTVVQVGIKYPDFKTVQRQRTIEKPTNLQKEIADISFELLCKAHDMSRPVRLLSVSTSGLVDVDNDFYQLNLFMAEKNNENQEKIESTLDDIRKKFGKGVIRFGYMEDDETGIK